MKKLLKVEKWIIASSKNDVVYRCSEHGIFAKRKDVADGKCVRTNCNGIVEEVENIEELRKQCITELGYDQD